MKKFLTLLLPAFLVIGLMGCGSQAVEEEAEETGELTGTITWTSWGSDTEIEYNELLSEAFMEAYPGTTVIYEAQNDDYTTAVETRYLAGESYDVIYGHPSTLLSWMQEGMLMDISDVYENNDFLWGDEYMTNIYELYQYDGAYYATVAGADTFVLFYNKTKLEEAGYTEMPDENTTWEELIEMAKATTERDSDGNPVSLGLVDCFGYYQFFPILYSLGGSFLDDMNNPTEVTFASDAALEALEILVDSISGDDAFAVIEGDYDFLTGGFAAGEYTFQIDGVYDVVYYLGIEDFEWDIAPLPGTMQSAGDTAVLTAGYAVSNQTENADLAKAFVTFCMTAEAQTLISGSGIFTSINTDVATSDEVLDLDGAPEHHYYRSSTVEYGQNLQGQCLCWNEMMDVFQSYLDQLYAGEITAQECMDGTQADCSALLEAELG